jgi:hypothetical protein
MSASAAYAYYTVKAEKRNGTKIEFSKFTCEKNVKSIAAGYHKATVYNSTGQTIYTKG